MLVSVTFDPAKRHRTLNERGLDFADAAQVFGGRTLQLEDTRATTVRNASLRSAGYGDAW